MCCDEEDENIRICGKCETMQCMEECSSEATAHLMRAFGKVVEDISEKWGVSLTKVSLLKARPFDMEVRDGIIRSVQRRPRVT